MKRQSSLAEEATLAPTDHAQLVQDRNECEITVKGMKVMKTIEYVESLNLNPEVLQYNLKDHQDSQTYFLEVKIVSENPTSWTIKRRYKDFIALSKSLNKELNSNKKLPKIELNPLPDYMEEKYGESPVYNLRSLVSYLAVLIGNSEIRVRSQAIYDFLELSLLQLPPGTKKFKENYLKKRSGGRYKENRCQVYCGVMFRNWLKRWCIITNEGIVYIIDNQSSRVRESLLFDQSFQVEYGRKATGTKRGITLSTSTRKLHLQADDVFQAIDWISSIEAAVKECPYVQTNRFLSFAPLRPPVAECKWYVDGDGYFTAVYEALLHAKKEVFITGWWVSPELYLKRPVKEGDLTYRLDTVLKKIADQGVRIRVIAWREVKMVGLYNDSEHTKKVLQGLSPNIRVIRHGSRFPYLWSHHEKTVIIDQTIGFLGGLDLCYGRMDYNSHPLNDPEFDRGEGETFPGIDFSNSRNADFQKVRDFTTCLIDKAVQPRMPWHDIAMRVIGEPVRDLSRHFIQYWNYAEIDLRFRKDNFLAMEDGQRFKSPGKTKQGRITMLKNTFHSFLGNNKKDDRTQSMSLENGYFLVGDDDSPVKAGNPKKRDQNKQFESYVESKIHSRDASFLEKKANNGEESKEEKIILTKQNPFQKSIVDSQIKSQTTSLVRTSDEKKKLLTSDDITLKIGSRDRSSSFGEDKSPSERQSKIGGGSRRRSKSITSNPNYKFDKQYVDLLRNIREKEIQSIIHQNEFKEPPKNLNIVEKIEERLGHDKIRGEVAVKEEDLLQLSYAKSFLGKGTCSCQVLRSASNWSLGLNSWKNIFENSIQNAYIELIQNAKHFVYIENQFFISSTAGDQVTNEIAHALLLRIQKAHELREKFRVVVFLPLLPGFEGEIDDPKATVLKIQMHWQYQTICRGGKSLYEELMKREIIPYQYIRFYSLRQHASMNGIPVTEIIYIHSKLMIVDDNIVIMGSANINDRSMQGSRDSEIAMVIEDSKKITVKINGTDTEVGQFAHSLRKELYNEHLDAVKNGIDVEDPLSTNLNVKMEDIAKRNTDIYREVFACYPDDNIKRLSDVKEFKAQKKLEEYEHLKDQIRGNIVHFPLSFLEEANLTFAKTDKEFIVPAENFT